MTKPRYIDFIASRLGAKWTVVSRRTGRYEGEITRKQYAVVHAEYVALYGEPYPVLRKAA